MGAVTGTTVISITPVTPAAPAGTATVGPGYLFGPEGTVFVNPVKINLAVVLSQLPTGKTINDVVIYTAPQNSTSYTAMVTTVADATHVSATTNHFSVFVPAVTAATTTPCKATCTNTSSGCTCTATCETVAYTMTCFSGEGCSCGGQNVTSHPLCSDLAGLNTAWTSAATAGCAFPGTVSAAP